jgi:tryptophan synthase alpha chain
MKNRITKLFEDKTGDILSIYITAGYPNLDSTLEVIKNLDRVGVDMIELGFPFSDPLADGPVIQQSGQTAINNGMTLAVLFDQLEELRKVTSIPMVLMGYLNPVLQFGEHQFIRKCAEVGIDGIIIPDLPMNYYLSNFEEICTSENIFNIMLVSPQTSEKRIKEIDEHCNGFLYVVSSNSITGSVGGKMSETYLTKIKQLPLKNPTLTGFGIHDNLGFTTACKYSKGAIIGSAFIKHISTNGTSYLSIQQFVNTIR